MEFEYPIGQTMMSLYNDHLITCNLSRDELVKADELIQLYTKAKRDYKYYSNFYVGAVNYKMKRNLFFYLFLLSTFVEDGYQSEKETTISTIILYKEIISILKHVAKLYCEIKDINETNPLVEHPEHIFESLIKKKITNPKTRELTYELAKQLIKEYENMVYVIINHSECIKFDIKYYSNLFWEFGRRLHPNVETFQPEKANAP